MGTTNKSNKNFTGVVGAITVAGSLIKAVTPLVEKAIDNSQKNPREKEERDVMVPELYRKGFPIDLGQAEEILIQSGLKVSKSKLGMKAANPKYRNYEVNQVIGSSPKQGTKVKLGTVVCLRYIPAEVIEESRRIFDESNRIKLEAKEQKAVEKQERKERFKEGVSNTADSVKGGLGKIFKREKDVKTEEKEN